MAQLLHTVEQDKDARKAMSKPSISETLRCVVNAYSESWDGDLTCGEYDSLMALADRLDTKGEPRLGDYCEFLSPSGKLFLGIYLGCERRTLEPDRHLGYAVSWGVGSFVSAKVIARKAYDIEAGYDAEAEANKEQGTE